MSCFMVAVGGKDPDGACPKLHVAIKMNAMIQRLSRSSSLARKVLLTPASFERSGLPCLPNNIAIRSERPPNLRTIDSQNQAIPA